MNTKQIFLQPGSQACSLHFWWEDHCRKAEGVSVMKQYIRTKLRNFLGER